MEQKEEWEVGGFQFGTEKDAALAKTEMEKIAFGNFHSLIRRVIG